MSAKTSAIEKHILEFDDFNVVVEVTLEGRVLITFCHFGHSPLCIDSHDFQAVAEFIERHGDINVIEREDG